MQKRDNLFYTAAYIRLSKEDGDKEESNSVKNQRDLLTDYITQKESFILYNTYIDDGYSGTNFERPSFLKLIADIKDGRVNCVVVKDLSRFGRDYIDTGRYLERYFPQLGVRFISLADGIDSMAQPYDMLLPIKNIFNEQYARDISKKVHTAVRTKQSSGAFIGAFSSYGYKKSPTDKNKLIIDEYPAAIVKKIFSLYIQGVGKSQIARLLNEEGILCPSEYKAASGLNYYNSNRLNRTSYWSYSTINSILHREIYTGTMVQGTKRQHMNERQYNVAKEDWIIVPHTHEAIIDPETFNKARQLLEKRTRLPDWNTGNNIFAGLLKCNECGRAMVKTTCRRADGSPSVYFYCGTYKRHGKHLCSPHKISLTVLETIVLNDLRTLLSSIRSLEHLVTHIDFQNQTTKKPLDPELHRLTLELERTRRLKKSIYEDFKEGLLDQDEFLAYRGDYCKKEELFSRQIQLLEERKKETEPADSPLTPWIKQLLEQNDIAEIDRTIVADMVDQIAVSEDHTIRIVYKFSNPANLPFNDIAISNP